MLEIHNVFAVCSKFQLFSPAPRPLRGGSRTSTSFTGAEDNQEKSVSVEIPHKTTVTTIWQWLKKSRGKNKGGLLHQYCVRK